jgi:hypothetical protein
MYHNSPSIDVSDAFDIFDVSEDEQHKLSVYVEHMEENVAQN